MRHTPGAGDGLVGRRDECTVLDRIVGAVTAGESRVLVVHGEPGVGKTALLDYLIARAPGCQVVRASGVQSEMELAFAGLHQLLTPLLEQLERLPMPQQEALRIALGLSTGTAPDRFLVGLAALGLLAEAASARPLICVVDDEQWLDRASLQALAFVARRLSADPVGLVFAARVPDSELADVPELPVRGLRDDDARALLDSALAVPVDRHIRDLIVAETRGNPLALLELPRGLAPAELAGGFGLPAAVALPRRIEDSFGRQLASFPEETRRLLALAAADPSGDPLLVWRAADRLGITAQASVPAAAAGLIEFGTRVRFRHPLARSAAYRAAPLPDRQALHAALAQATDPAVDRDRRAWHLAQAAHGPDEGVAAELEASAGRAQRRGGLAAAAAFLERAALLTPDPVARAERLLAAARTKRESGALDAALRLLDAAEAGLLDRRQASQAEYLRGLISYDQWRMGEATLHLLGAARRLTPMDAALAREAHLDALAAAIDVHGLGGPDGLREAADAARQAPPGPQPPRPVDLMLDSFALRLTEGHAASAAALTTTLQTLLALDGDTAEGQRWLWLVGAGAASLIALELWDFDLWRQIAMRQVQYARDVGAPVQLQSALNYLGGVHLLSGDLSTTKRLMDEEALIAGATGNPPNDYTAALLTAWQGREQVASGRIDDIVQAALARGNGQAVDAVLYGRAVLHNSLGRHSAARDIAWKLFEHDHVGFGPQVLPELAEAAARTGDTAALQAAVDWMSELTRVTRTDWALGLDARIQALSKAGEAADSLYQESIQRLGKTPIRTQLARSHLLYGEWLRRQARRVDARRELRTAHSMLDEMGVAGFAERARRELLATGETVRKRNEPSAAAAGTTLTPQEAEVARLARDGLSNPEIGARLFISARTVQYHLRKVFTKLDISSRGQLHRVLKLDSDADGIR